MAINYISIGEKIREFRCNKGLTQAALSEAVGISPSYMSQIETGSKCVSLETLVLLANALYVSADQLLKDNLENITAELNCELSEALANCSEYEKRVLTDLGASALTSLRANKKFLRKKY